MKIEISKSHSRNSIGRAEGLGAMSSRKERECPCSVIDDSHRQDGCCLATPDPNAPKAPSLSRGTPPSRPLSGKYSSAGKEGAPDLGLQASWDTTVFQDAAQHSLTPRHVSIGIMDASDLPSQLHCGSHYQPQREPFFFKLLPWHFLEYFITTFIRSQSSISGQP